MACWRFHLSFYDYHFFGSPSNRCCSTTAHTSYTTTTGSFENNDEPQYTVRLRNQTYRVLLRFVFRIRLPLPLSSTRTDQRFFCSRGRRKIFPVGILFYSRHSVTLSSLRSDNIIPSQPSSGSSTFASAYSRADIIPLAEMRLGGREI